MAFELIKKINKKERNLHNLALTCFNNVSSRCNWNLGVFIFRPQYQRYLKRTKIWGNEVNFVGKTSCRLWATNFFFPTNSQCQVGMRRACTCVCLCWPPSRQSSVCVFCVGSLTESAAGWLGELGCGARSHCNTAEEGCTYRNLSATVKKE